MKKIVILGLIIFVVLGAYSQTKKNDIAQLIDIMGTKQNLKIVYDEEILKPLFSSWDNEVGRQAIDTMHKFIDYDKYVDSVITIYDKYYSHEDIKNLIAFYKTPTGKKTLNTKLTQEVLVMAGEFNKETENHLFSILEYVINITKSQ